MMNVSELMKRHRIERIVFAPASELVPQDSFHAWPIDTGLHRDFDEVGRGPTVESAIFDAVARKTKAAA